MQDDWLFSGVFCLPSVSCQCVRASGRRCWRRYYYSIIFIFPTSHSAESPLHQLMSPPFQDVTAVSVNSLCCYWHDLVENQFFLETGSRLRCLRLRICVCVYISSKTMQSAAPEVEDSFDFLFKIILVGDSNVGKTCVVQSFKSGIFMEKQQNTIGVDFTVRTLDIDGKKVKVSVFLGGLLIILLLFQLKFSSNLFLEFLNCLIACSSS